MSGLAPRAGRRSTPATSTIPLPTAPPPATQPPVSSSPTWMTDSDLPDFLGSPPASPSTLPPVQSKPAGKDPSTPRQQPLQPESGGDLPWLSQTATPSSLVPPPSSVSVPPSQAVLDLDLPFLTEEDPSRYPSLPRGQQSVDIDYPHQALPARPQSLEEQRDELLAELHQTEVQIGRKEIALSSIRGDSRRATEGQRLQLEQRRVEKERELMVVDKKCRDDLRFLDTRLQSIASKQEAEAAELNLEYRTLQEQRKRSLLGEIQVDITTVKRDLERYLSQQELLLATNPWGDTQDKVDVAVSARLKAARTLPEQLAAATDLLLDHHRALDEKVERRVAHFINLETALAAQTNFDERRRVLREGLNERKVKFSEFKTELLVQSANFHGQRHDTRSEGLHDIQCHQRAVLKELREASIGLTTATQADAHIQFEAATAAHKAALEAETLRIKSKFSTLEEQDIKLSADQRNDIECRFAATRVVTERLQEEERESLRTVLSKEAERAQAVLADGQARVQNIMRSPDGSAIQSSTEVSSAMARLSGLIDKAFGVQLERNTAYRLLLTAPDGSSSVVPKGVSSKEARLLGLLQEKQGVLRALQTTSKQQLEHLSISRESMLSTLGKVEAQMTAIAAQIHDGRLQQQAALGRVEVARASWEDEHRATLSFGKRKNSLDGPTVDFKDGGAGFYPALQVLHHVASQAKFSADRATELHTSFAQKRKALQTQQRVQDAQVEGEGTSLADAWQSLMERMLAYNDEFKRISTQQVALLGEEAKIAVETDLLGNERAALAKKSAALHREQEELRERGRRLQQEASQVSATSGSLNKESMATAEEVRRLVTLQSDLRQQQASHFADLRRMDNAKVRMLGSWGRGESPSLSNHTALLSVSAPSGASEADTSFVPMHYFPPSTSSSSKASSTQQQQHRPSEALTEPPSPVSTRGS